MFFLIDLFEFKKKIMKKLLLSLSFITLCSAANAQSWTVQSTGFPTASSGVESINVIDANTVWALAYDGSVAAANYQRFTKTINGGTNWTPGTINLGDPLLQINNLVAVNATTAWVSSLIPADGNGVIHKTNDSGATWVEQTTGGYLTNGSSFLNGVYFFNALEGLAYGDPAAGEFEIYRTGDGGDSWTQTPAANIPNPLGGAEFGYNNAPISAAGVFWFVTDKGRIYKTINKGLNWTVSQAPVVDFGGITTANNTATLLFSDALNGCILKRVGPIATAVYTLYKTTDGGTTWGTGVTYTNKFKTFSYVPGTSVLVGTGSAGSPVVQYSGYSLDTGTNWTDIDSGTQRVFVTMLNGSTGWASGFTTSPTVGGIYKFNGSLGTTAFESTSQFTVYPNPANNNVTIATTGVESYKLSVTDLTGKVVMEKSLNGIENTLDVSVLSSGAYFFTLNSGDKKETVKIIKN